MTGIDIQQVAGWLNSEKFLRLRRWGVKGGIAIVDQGLFSGSNFVLNILLARWLRPEEYGAFSLAFAVYLFFSGFHNALILEPMSVLGTAKYAESLKKYFSGQFILHVFLTGSAGLLIVLAGILFLYFQIFDGFLARSLIGAGIFLPLMLLMWLARRSCYVAGMPGRALTASLVYSVTTISGAIFLHNWSTASNAVQWYFLLGIASLAGSLIVYLNPNMFSFGKTDWRKLLAEQWNFGKWIVLATFLNFAATQVQLFAAAVYLGLDQAGVFRALQNFMLPMLQVLIAISILSLPSIAYEFGQQTYDNMRKRSSRVTGALVILSALYVLALYYFGDPLERALYSGEFSQYSSLIPIIALVPLITAIEVRYSLVVRSLQRPIYHAVLTGMMAFVGIVFGILMTQRWGIAGAVYSLTVVALVSLATNVWFYHRWFLPKLAEEYSTG